jgi:hypothetical protein
MQQALALGVPTGLFCAVVLARQFKEAEDCKLQLATKEAVHKQELTDIKAEHKHELEAMQTKHIQEIAHLTARHEQEIADKYVQRDTHEKLKLYERWFHYRTYVHTYALDLFMFLKNTPDVYEEGARCAWRLGTNICNLHRTFVEMHPEEMSAYLKDHEDLKLLFGGSPTRELRSKPTTPRQTPHSIHGDELLKKLHNLTESFKVLTQNLEPAQVIPPMVDLMEYALLCFKHFFLKMPPDMSENDFIDTNIHDDVMSGNMFNAWTNYFDPSP